MKGKGDQTGDSRWLVHSEDPGDGGRGVSRVRRGLLCCIDVPSPGTESRHGVHPPRGQLSE